MGKNRVRHSAELNAKVGHKVLKEVKTVDELAGPGSSASNTDQSMEIAGVSRGAGTFWRSSRQERSGTRNILSQAVRGGWPVENGIGLDEKLRAWL